jgi:hypothetical protein
MSFTIANGQSREMPVATGQLFGVFPTRGNYTLVITSGPGRGTVLANNLTTTANYGPWTKPVVATISCTVGAEIDFDVAVSPVDDRETPVVKTGAAGVALFTAGVGIGAPTIKSGAGTPEGAVTAPVGSLFLRTNGGALTTLYVKEVGAGNTGWAAK